jgi:outer membrane biosynthesis protein TonB
MSTTSRVAGAVAAGYVLGRFKKLRMAVLVASAMSSPKFRNAAADMIQSRIPGGAIVGGLTREVGGRLVDVGKTAATSIVASRIDTLSQNLAERSDNLRKGTPSGKARKSEPEQPEDEYEEEEAEEPEQPEDEYEEEEAEEPEQPEDEYEEEEAEEPEDEYQEQEGEEAEEPEDQKAQTDDEASPEEEPEEQPVTRSPRRRRSASPAGRRRG